MLINVLMRIVGCLGVRSGLLNNYSEVGLNPIEGLLFCIVVVRVRLCILEFVMVVSDIVNRFTEFGPRLLFVANAFFVIDIKFDRLNNIDFVEKSK